MARGAALYFWVFPNMSRDWVINNDLPHNVDGGPDSHQVSEVALVVQESSDGTERELEEELDRSDPGDTRSRDIGVSLKLVIVLCTSCQWV